MDESKKTYTKLSNSLTPQVQVLERRPLRSGHPVVVGVIDAFTLVSISEVPRRNTTKEKGYQREANRTRVRKLQNELLRDQVDMPTSILLSMRDSSDCLHEDPQGTKLLSIAKKKMYIVDGQHRVAALSELVEEDPKRWGDYQLTFVCILGADEQDEMEQFYVVNSTAKSVRTDLAYELLKQRAKNDPRFLEILDGRGETWKVRGQEIVEELANQPGLWENRIRFTGQKIGSTTIPNSGLVNSLKPVVMSAFFGNHSVADQTRILEAYWNGIKATLPDCFDKPTDFVLQRNTGAITMHTFLLDVIEHVRTAGRPVEDPDSYLSVLSEPLLKLEGENREGTPVSGAEFWRVGLEGAAGLYSTNTGRRVLLAKLRMLMPKLEIDSV